MTRGNRQNSLLTSGQRNYLRGESDLKPNSEREMRRRIRERLASGLFDFRILNDYLAREDLAQTLEKDPMLRMSQNRYTIGEETVEYTQIVDEMHGALLDLCLFLYHTSGNPATFGNLIETSIEEIYARHHPDTILNDVNLDIDARRQDYLVDVAEERMDNGDDLKPGMVTALLKSAEHDDAEVGDYLRSVDGE